MSDFVQDEIIEPVKDLTGTDDLFPKAPTPPISPDLPDNAQAPKPLSSEQSPEIRAAVDQQRKRLRAARGRKATILTAGVTLGEPETRRRTILGG